MVLLTSTALVPPYAPCRNESGMSAPARWAAVATASAVGLSMVIGGAQAAVAGSSAPVATRAAIAPSLVAGRGATVDFAEQEAEHARFTGAVIGPDRTAYTLPSEASGR